MVLPDEWEPGTPLTDALPLAEDILLVESTGNRPDLMSTYGIAREVAALYDLEPSPPPGRDPRVAGDGPSTFPVGDLDGCPPTNAGLSRPVALRLCTAPRRTR